MRRCSIAVAFLAVVAGTWSAASYAIVYHGRDDDTGAMISRTSVDTITPGDGIHIGLKVVRGQADKKVTLAFTSLDKKLKDLDTSSASLQADSQSIPLKFAKYHALIIHESLPPLHELWFETLDQASIDKIAQCKTLSLTISDSAGTSLERALKPKALSDVKEVLSGPGAKE